MLAARHADLKARVAQLKQDPDYSSKNRAHKAAIESLVKKENRQKRAAYAKSLAEWRDSRKVLGIDHLAEQMDEVTAAMDPLVSSIVAATATTLAGVAVKARSAAFFCSHWSGEDADCDQQQGHNLIQSVLALATAEVRS